MKFIYIQLNISSYRLVQKDILKQTFKSECEAICPNEDELCDIVLDLCYPTNKSKQFAWDICGDVFIRNLLKLNNGIISYPTLFKDGDIEYGGNKFVMESIQIGDDIDKYCTE